MGVTHDISLWRTHGPPLGDDELALCDRAYISKDVTNALAPYKKPKKGHLTQAQKDTNEVIAYACCIISWCVVVPLWSCNGASQCSCSIVLRCFCRWFRAGIEHAIAQTKNFGILSARYRGQLDKDNGLLHAIVTVILGLQIWATQAKPLRVHTPLLDENELDVVDEKAAEFESPREFIAGMAIGRYQDLRLVRGRVKGPGDEPDDSDINSGNCARDFVKSASACFVCFDFLFLFFFLGVVVSRDNVA